MGFKRGFLIQDAMPPVPTPSILDKAALAFYFTKENLLFDESEQIIGAKDSKSGVALSCYSGVELSKIGDVDAIKISTSSALRYASGVMPEIFLNKHTVVCVQNIRLNSKTNFNLPETQIRLQNNSARHSGGNTYYLNKDGSVATANVEYTQVGGPVTSSANFNGSYDNQPVVLVSISDTTLDAARIFLNGIEGDLTPYGGVPYSEQADGLYITASYKPTPIDAENIVGCALFYDRILTDVEIGEATQKLAEIYGIAL